MFLSDLLELIAKCHVSLIDLCSPSVIGGGLGVPELNESGATHQVQHRTFFPILIPSISMYLHTLYQTQAQRVATPCPPTQFEGLQGGGGQSQTSSFVGKLWKSKPVISSSS